MLRPLVLLAIIVALAVGAAAQPVAAQEEIDISGEWTVEGLPFIESGCPMTIAQAGNLLAITTECIRLDFSGEIDPGTGDFTLTPSPLSFPHTDFEGTATNDALRMVSTGDFLVNPLVVEGTRKSAPSERRNISGDWQSVLSGVEEMERCVTSIWHRGEELEITLDCASGTGGSFAGTINMDSGRFLLQGEPFGEDVKLEGVASQSGRALAAFWSLPSSESGTLTGRLQVRTGGVVAVDCDGATEGVQESCAYDTGETFLIQVHIVEAPPDGYNGFELAVEWTVPQLAYRPSETIDNEFLEQGCATAGRGNQWVRRVRPQPLVGYVCLNPAGSDIRLPAGVPVELEVSCWAAGIGTLSIGAGVSTILWLGGVRGSGPLDLIRPLKTGASVTCRPKNGQLGDIDCSGVVDSVDAALVLQFSALLVDPLGCDYKGDMTQNGRLDSRDALLVLQLEAGLIERLPVL